MPPAEPKISPYWLNSQAPRIPGSAAEPPGQPCLPSPITLISLPTPSPSPVRQAPPIPSPAWIWSSFVKTRSWISHFPAAARAVPEVVADKTADKADPEVEVREAEAALAEAEEASEAVAVVSEEVGDAAAEVVEA